MPLYEEFDASDYTKLRRSLIRKPARGSAEQREFLARVRDTGEFLEYMKTAVSVQPGESFGPLAERMSEAEFGNPPSDTERRLADAWKELTPRVACRSTFWGCVTWRHIEAGQIESSFLAANGTGASTGTQRIDTALAATGEMAVSQLDGCVRTVLRRLGGLPEVRGNRSVYVNCPLARAWWRERLVREVAADDVELARQVRAVVHPESLQYWEDLVTFVVSRNSVFGSTAVRNILIRTLAKALDADPRSRLRMATELKRLCRSVSSIQASIELSVVSEDDAAALMGDMVRRVASA